MEGADALGLIAEVGIAIAGFAGVVATLRAPRGRVRAYAAFRIGILLGLSASTVLLALLPFTEYAILQSPRYEEVLASITAEQTLLIGLVLGFFLAEQLLHYYCDRCLFRFRTADVRRKVEPLLMGVGPAR